MSSVPYTARWRSRSESERWGHFYDLSWMCSSGLGHSVKASSVESLQELITSDSEGSYMGDLQSPVFQDRPDAQVKPQHLHDINSQHTHASVQVHLLQKATATVYGDTYKALLKTATRLTKVLKTLTRNNKTFI